MARKKNRLIRVLCELYARIPESIRCKKNVKVLTGGLKKIPMIWGEKDIKLKNTIYQNEEEIWRNLNNIIEEIYKHNHTEDEIKSKEAIKDIVCTENMLDDLRDIITCLYTKKIGKTESKKIIEVLNNTIARMRNEDKKSLFLKLPRSNGMLAEIQDSEANLLYLFDKICRRNNIDYMISYGTLLGSARHSGWVPWDDDVDLLMFDGEIEKLKRILDNNSDIELKKIIIRGDHPIFKPSKYYWVKFKGSTVPTYLDIFPIMYVDKTFNLDKCYYNYLSDVSNNINTNKDTVTTAEYLDEIESTYDYFRDSIRDVIPGKQKIILLVDMVGRLILFDNCDMMPLRDYDFEEFKVKGPQDANSVLKKWFGEYYRLPNEINTRRHSIFNDTDIVKIRHINNMYDRHRDK